MTTELTMLALSILVGIVQILISSFAAKAQAGWQRTLSGKAPRPQLTGVADRLDRALRNFLETFPLFVAAVLIAHVTHRHSRLTVVGAEMYVVARVVYVPLYACAVPVVRSLVWGAATLGILLILLASVMHQGLHFGEWL